MISAMPAAAGGGVWIRLRLRFGPRLTECLLGVITLGWGCVVLLPGHLFDQPSYAGFRIVFGSEFSLGLVMAIFGTARLVGLLINGARRRVTPWIRIAGAGVGLIVWVGMITAHCLALLPGEWMVFYPVFSVAEIFNIHRAAHDAGESYGLP